MVMRLGFLGIDALTSRVAQAAATAGHQIIGVAEASGPELDALRRVAPGCRVVDDWQALFSGGDVTALIVARGTDDQRRVDQLRQLMQTGLPMIVAHPVVSSMLSYFELDLYRQESGCLVIPLVPARWHPAVQRAIARQSGTSVLAGDIKQFVVEQFILERSLIQRDRASVVDALIRDADLLRHFCGELNRINALAPAGAMAAGDWGAVGAQFAGSGGLVARWSVVPAIAAAGARVTLVGRAETAVLEMPDVGPWTWTVVAAGQTVEQQSFPDWDPARAALDQLAAAVDDDRDAHDSTAAAFSATPTWVDACRDLELADAVERSLQRGRAIDLHFEEHSEQGTFKGLMAAGGCLLLMTTLAVVVLASMFGGLNVRGAEWWPYVLLTILGLFLAAQCLRLAFPSAAGQPEKAPHRS